jgi:glycosyltransferase involved in cell wall biosynthesis
VSSISTIIPNYNRETLLGETIANVLAQTLPPHEVIVVDDGSTDNSVEVIRSFGPKIKLIQQTNQGPGAARNAGLRLASGDFIQFQDSDDLFSHNKLERQAKLLEQTGADIAFSPWVKLKTERCKASLENHVLQQRMPPSKLRLPCSWLRGWFTVIQSLLFRRSFLERVGFYRTDLMLGEDVELFFRALTSSPKVAFSADTLTLYRLHNLNKITQNENFFQSRHIIDWARCLQLMMEHAKGCGLNPDWLTRSIFLSRIKKHLRYLRAAPDAPVGLVEYLSKQTAGMPGIWLAAVEGLQQLAEQWRLRSHGSRWMPGYQAAPPSAHQLRLIRELGFEVV